MSWAPTRRRTERGSSILYVVVLAPVIFLCLALALESGALQLEKERLRSAADVAVEAAANRLSSVNGGVHLDVADADAVVREALLDNLQPLAGEIVGESPADVAASAQLEVVTDVPAGDPFSEGRVLLRPTVEILLDVPVRSGLLSVAGLPPVLHMTIESSADLRVVGLGST